MRSIYQSTLVNIAIYLHHQGNKMEGYFGPWFWSCQYVTNWLIVLNLVMHHDGRIWQNTSIHLITRKPESRGQGPSVSFKGIPQIREDFWLCTLLKSPTLSQTHKLDQTFSQSLGRTLRIKTLAYRSLCVRISEWLSKRQGENKAREQQFYLLFIN